MAMKSKTAETKPGPAPEARYPLRVQAIRSSGQNTRFFVYIPMPLAAALAISGGEPVEWRLLARDELRLLRTTPTPTNAKKPR